MFKFEKEYKPYKAEIRGTDNTVFMVPQYHKDKDGNFCKDGFLNILTKGIYELNEGDSIIVRPKETTGIGMQKNGQYTNFTLYVKSVEVVRKEPTDKEVNNAILRDDIPDDLF